MRARYWRRVFDVDFLVDEGVIDPEDRELFWFAESADEAWRGILAWYAAKGSPLAEQFGPARYRDEETTGR